MPDPVELAALIARCADEPIHAPGGVQPHGALVAVDTSGLVVVVSANSATILGAPPASWLGRPVASLLGEATDAVLDATDGDVLQVKRRGRAWEVVGHRSGGLHLLELEEAPSEIDHASERINLALRKFHGAASPEALVAQAAEAVQDLTGFDRVLVYRFDPEWNGEVISEITVPGTTEFLGLRFPASDIPPQARALYRRARLRLIADATAPPSALVALDDAAATDLDLSDVSIRAVSPVHLQYLQNMGVTASMSVAIQRGERLWGLIACHQLSGRLVPSLRVRQAVDLVGQTTSTVLAALLEAESAVTQMTLLRRIDAASDAMSSEGSSDPGAVLAALGPAFPALLDATGAAVVRGGNALLVGRCPPEAAVMSLVDLVATTESRELHVRELSTVDPAWTARATEASGAIVVPIDAQPDAYVCWFRTETRELIRWGGDPSSTDVAPGEHGQLSLNPRASFDEYLERVDGRSTPWTSEELSAARSVAHRLSTLYARWTQRNAEVSALIQRTVMLEQFPAIPDVIGDVRYIPSAGDPIGGDWYDVFFRADGNPVVALGDVAGHGLEAAATMAQLRHALRAYVLREDTPAEAMTRLNDLMITLLPNEVASVLLVTLHPVTREAEIVNAGHLPPIVASPDTTRFLDARPDYAIGVAPGTQYHATRVALPRGCTLIAYTDGLVERRRQSIDQSLDAVLEVTGALATSSPAQICDRLLAFGTASTDIDDDITVVALQFVGEATDPSTK
jgi:chemotaxis family two-component system sensor kinase Cph1